MIAQAKTPAKNLAKPTNRNTDRGGVLITILSGLAFGAGFIVDQAALIADILADVGIADETVALILKIAGLIGLLYSAITNPKVQATAIALLLPLVAAFGQVAVPLPDCESMTGRTAHAIFPGGAWQLPEQEVFALSEDGAECFGRASASSGPFALTVWGFDDLSAAHLGKGGADHGERIRYAVRTEGLVHDVQIGFQADQYASADLFTYGTDRFAIVGAATLPALLDTATVGFAADTLAPSGGWTASLRVASPVPLGAVIVEFRTSGDAAVQSITPAAQTYIAGDTLAAAFIGAGSANVNFTLQGSRAGTVSLFRIRGTDRNGNLIGFRPEGAQSVVIVEPPLLVMDLNGDGTLSDADIRLLFLAFIRDQEDQYLPAADVWPWPAGDGQVTLVDLYYAELYNATRRLPDGREVQ